VIHRLELSLAHEEQSFSYSAGATDRRVTLAVRRHPNSDNNSNGKQRQGGRAPRGWAPPHTKDSTPGVGGQLRASTTL